jgi:hypothetical protein
MECLRLCLSKSFDVNAVEDVFAEPLFFKFLMVMLLNGYLQTSNQQSVIKELNHHLLREGCSMEAPSLNCKRKKQHSAWLET